MALRTSRLLGNSTPRLDDKGRLIVPARYRSRFAEGLVMARGYDRTIDVYPVEVFDATLAQFEAADESDAHARGMLRMLSWHAFEGEIDSQGRLTLPPKLREYAGITRDVAVAATARKLEIWDLARFEAYDAQTMPIFAERDTGRGAANS